MSKTRGCETLKIIRACKEVGLPEPVIEERGGGFQVIFSQDLYTAASLQQFDLNGRQINALTHYRSEGKLTNAQYRELNQVSKATATRDLQDLQGKGLLKSSHIKGAGSEFLFIGSIGS